MSQEQEGDGSRQDLGAPMISPPSARNAGVILLSAIRSVAVCEEEGRFIIEKEDGEQYQTRPERTVALFRPQTCL